MPSWGWPPLGRGRSGGCCSPFPATARCSRRKGRSCTGRRAASKETGAIGQLSFSFAGHGEMLAPNGPILYGTKGCIKGESVLLDGQSGTTLDEHFAQHGAAQADALFPRGMSDAFGLLIGDWLRSI